MTQVRLRLLMIAAIAAIPLSARADGIDLPVALAGGVIFIVPLLAFNVAVEGFISARFFRAKFRDLWWSMCKANILTLLAGIPILILNGVLVSEFAPMAFLGQWSKTIICMKVFNFFLATVGVEFLFLRKRILRGAFAGAPRVLWRGLFWAHVASYGVLVPLFVLPGLLGNHPRGYSANTKWACQPPSQVLFVSTNQELQTIMTDGSGHRTLLTNEVRDFVISPGLDTILFRGIDNQYFISSGESVRLVTAKPLRCGGQGMDFSPGGRFVGLLQMKDQDVYMLLWDRDTGKTTETGLGNHDRFQGCRLVWSTNENVFYVRLDANISKVIIRDPATTPAGAAMAGIEFEKTPFSGNPTDLAEHFGRIGETEPWNSDPHDWEFSYFQVNAPEEHERIYIEQGLAPFIHAAAHGYSVTISDPDALGFGQRSFQQAAFTASGKELLFEDESHDGHRIRHICLVDLQTRRAGLITLGHRFLLMAPFFSKSGRFLKSAVPFAD